MLDNILDVIDHSKVPIDAHSVAKVWLILRCAVVEGKTYLERYLLLNLIFSVLLTSAVLIKQYITTGYFNL